jgi:SAM-dependent methyltransferase
VSARPHSDGSAGDVDYAPLAGGYRSYRQPDPRVASAIAAALGDARTVLNVGAGAGSYEPVDRIVTAVEPSTSMRAQRPADRPAIDATAESLPFADDTFDASMATFSVHQWSDVEAGLAEMRRVTRGPVVILSIDPAQVERFWLNDYAPEVMATEASRYPAIDRVARALGGEVDERFARHLAADLESGAWDEKYGPLRNRPEFDAALRLVVARPASRA